MDAYVPCAWDDFRSQGARMSQVHPSGSTIAARRIVLSLVLFLATLLSAASVTAAGVSLAWDAVTGGSVAGYTVHWGTTPAAYTSQLDAGASTASTVSGLAEGTTYYFAVSAYDAVGGRSSYSNEVSTTVPYAAPVANFTASATAGTAPLSVIFTSTSTGTITTYAWTFGDGTTSSSAAPTKSYSTPGLYTVSLTVTGPGGSNTKTSTGYINVSASVDSTPPSALASLSASASGSTAVNLSWTAATDNVGVTGYRVERCQGSGCTSFVQIATPTGTTFGDSGLAASTTYQYRVRATDAAGNLGGYSPVAAATTAAPPDTTAPSAPASLSASASGSTAVNLSWTVATDNVGVTGYRVERCQGSGCTSFAQIATPTGTTFGDSGLAASTTYQYRVRATDAAGNLGGYSPVAAATTAAPPDTTAPSAPASLSASASGSPAVNLSWTAATDNVGVTGYRVERCQGSGCTSFAQIATPTGTTFGDSGLAASTTYQYRVRATDAAGNLGGYSPVAAATTAAPPDTTAPSAPASLSASASGSPAVNLSWTAATDNVGVTGYRVERCQGSGCTSFTQIATPTGTTFSDSGRAASTTYQYRVRATDAAGNLGGYSPLASVATSPAPDTIPPTAPASLTATASGSTTVNLSWAAATDNVGVTGYRVERCQGSNCTSFTQIATPTGTTFSDTGRAASTTYQYRVRATDAAGNLGGYSPLASVATSPAPDTIPPTAPASLTATASGSTTVNLSWAAATDNVGVTGYRVERCQGSNCTSFTQIATPTGTTFSDTGRAAGTTYRYRVRATDAAGGLGAYSPIASATTTVAAPVASFTATPLTGTAPVTVNFTSTSSGSITSYAWSFGDGTTSTSQNPSKVYSAAGLYTVSLTVTGAGGSHTATQTNYVNVSAPPSSFANVDMFVDEMAVAGTSSNANGILEPGETVLIVPVWQMTAGSTVTVTASAQVSGSGSSSFGLKDNAAAYGSLTPGTTADCESATGNCYLLTVNANVRRPTVKWGITFTETLSTGATTSRSIPIGKSFADVAAGDTFYAQIEALVWNDVTFGYADGTYHPGGNVSRWQTAMFLARASSRGSAIPATGTVGTQAYACVAGGTSLFADVPPDDPGCAQLHYLAGRGTNLRFECDAASSVCPAAITTRATMAVWIAGALASGGDASVPALGTFNDSGTARSYNCAISGGSHFSDIASSSPLCRHANYLWARGIIDGYGDGTFQPQTLLTRGQMAKFIANAFKLKVR